MHFMKLGPNKVYIDADKISFLDCFWSTAYDGNLSVIVWSIKFIVDGVKKEYEFQSSEMEEAKADRDKIIEYLTKSSQG